MALHLPADNVTEHKQRKKYGYDPMHELDWKKKQKTKKLSNLEVR